MMNYLSAWNWIIFVLFITILVYTIGRIPDRIGLSPLWSVVVLVPVANLVGLWIVALFDWPRDRKDTR